jgi:hypothetical protein
MPNFKDLGLKIYSTRREYKMKNFIRLILTVILLYSFPVAADTLLEIDNFYTKDQDYNKEIDSIIIKFQNPLKDIEENIQKYAKLNTIFENFKQFDLELGLRLLNKVNNGDPLSGDDLYFLRRSIVTYYKINKKMLDFAKIYNFGGFETKNSLTSVDQHLPLIKAHIIYLTGHVQVLDHIVKMHKLYYQSSGLFRRIIKKALKDKDHSGSKTLNDLIKMSEYTINIGNKKEFANQITLSRNILEDLRKILSTDQTSLNLLKILETNETAIEIARGKKDFDISYHAFIDTISEAASYVTNWLSSIFGNIAGSIRWRKGFMFENETVISMMKEKLKPMDILLEKSPFVLTDKFIPGHYGHVALYLGTKEQLEAINMWNHPDILPYQESIENGNVILEAVRPGVKLSTLEEFSNIDEVTIIRKKDGLANLDEVIENISRGMDQIGKDYDFNFDVETLDKIVCSELIYIVYGQVKWQTKYRFGRATISPDDIAEVIFQQNTKFNIEQYLVSPERHRIEQGSMTALGKDLDFELRSSDGSPLKTTEDPTNSFWKKAEKCYNVTEENDLSRNVRQCKTIYTLEQYAERTVGN